MKNDKMGADSVEEQNRRSRPGETPMDETMRKVRLALEIGRDAAHELAQRYHSEMKGYRQHEHDRLDADVVAIDVALQALDAQPEPAPAHPAGAEADRNCMTAVTPTTSLAGSEHSRIDGDALVARVAALRPGSTTGDKTIGHGQGDQKAERRQSCIQQNGGSQPVSAAEWKPIESQSEVEALEFELGRLQLDTPDIADEPPSLFDRWRNLARSSMRLLRRAATPDKPLDMVLWCPRCGLQHVDAPEPEKGWANPPHKSHLCHGCGLIWRPATVATNGVDSVPVGQNDNWRADSSRFAKLSPNAPASDLKDKP